LRQCCCNTDGFCGAVDSGAVDSGAMDSGERKRYDQRDGSYVRGWVQAVG
jgi:hypothetical protein